MKLGFVGLGIMGTPMCLRLLAAGHDLYVKTRSTVPKAVTDAGAVVCATSAEVARQSDVIFTMVPDTPDVQAVLLGPEGVFLGLSPGKTVVDMSTISPGPTRELAERVEALGCNFVDAPVSGGEIGAQAGTLTIMVGAKVATFEKVRPLLELMGRNITHVGDVGAGQVTKAANQMIVALNIAAVAEALVFASRSGVDAAKVRQALLGGFASSRILEVHGERMVKRAFQPGFRIELHQKDINLALQAGKALSLPLPLTAAVSQLLHVCAAHGWRQLDHSALIRSVELMAAHALSADS